MVAIRADFGPGRVVDKMSKSAGNAILLSDDPEQLRMAGLGKVEGNVVFAMLDGFDQGSIR